ncbi:hypothetical protein HYW67_00015 [Candidatus Parcubacteria bacterium]|nr:hypothetical protein [Candidatus Parcubacteria bacterium]
MANNVQCKVCGQSFGAVTNTHLATHDISVSDYRRRYPGTAVGFALVPAQLAKGDLRYRRWRRSLLKRPPPWNRGQTKATHPGVARISATFRERGIDNFVHWRQKMEARGRFHHSYPDFPHTGDLAELIGLVLGDGHICRFARTESLGITLNNKYQALIERTAKLIQRVFHKKPARLVRRDANCTRLVLYQKDISRRLGIPNGNRSQADNGIPQWVWRHKPFLIRCLRGLYEAEGFFSQHLPTYTYKFSFTNSNPRLLNDVFRGISTLGFAPHREARRITISKRAQAFACRTLLRFREYN